MNFITEIDLMLMIRPSIMFMLTFFISYTVLLYRKFFLSVPGGIRMICMDRTILVYMSSRSMAVFFPFRMCMILRIISTTN